MFLRHDDSAGTSQKNSTSGLVKLGVGLLVAGGLLLGFTAIGGHLVGHPAFAAILLPIAGMVCLVGACVSYARRLRAGDRHPKNDRTESRPPGSI